MCKRCREVPLPTAAVQPARVWSPGTLHSHTCSECGRECACYQAPCRFRGRATHPGDRRRQFVCGLCEEPITESEAA
jgi:hypothetical protein